MARKKRYLFFTFFLIPLLLVFAGGMFEIQIKKQIGKTGWNAYMITTIILLVVLSFLPFVKLLTGFFSGNFSLFLGNGKKSRRIRETGYPGTATILSIGENSKGGVLTINGQPVLNLVLKIDDGKNPPYQVSFDTIIPRAYVPQFQPGATFSVKIDKQNRNMVVFDNQSTGAPGRPVVGNKLSRQDEILVKEYGKDGTAKILNIEDTGKSKNFNPVIKITYEITPEGLAPYTFTKEISAPTYAIEKMQQNIGKELKCRIHPRDKTKVIVTIP